MLLHLDHLHKSFGGLMATNNVSVTVNNGERVSIIGPNGAGKSTLFNQVSGYIRLDKGRVLYDGRDITGLSPHRIAMMGIGRAFQRSNIFPRLTAYENIQAAVISYRRQHFRFWANPTEQAAARERVRSLLHVIGLEEKQQQRKAGQLALGDQKRLEIGLALAMEPRLLLLDEPTAGMSPQETLNTVKLIDDITRQFGMSLLFTEHDMEVVFSISERIYVLHQGQIIAEGQPQQIADDPRVQAVYLGSSETAAPSAQRT